MKTILSIIFIVSGLIASATDYTTGVFILNEDWYGHQNSTLNYLQPDNDSEDYFNYRVIQTENPGVELGCTAQYGAIYNGRFYIIAKQAKDPGATVTGGRITIADATTMKVLRQLPLIDKSGHLCDGRSFVGVTASKGYVSTSDGIWVLDLDAMEITGKIEGTGNTRGGLYQGQCGSMVLAGDRVFVAHQSEGLIVIDATSDKVERTLSPAQILMDAGIWSPTDEDLGDIAAGDCTLEDCAPGIGSVIRAADGTLWASLSADIRGTGATCPALLQIDASTLDVTAVTIPAEVEAPATSWYAWTPDTFTASAVNNTIYWRGGGRWFGGTVIWRYNIDTRRFDRALDVSTDGQGWMIYGCSMRLHPVTDEIYCSLYHDNSQPVYITRRYSNDGVLIAEYPMIENYWFPSLPIFPQSGTQGIGPEIVPDSDTAGEARYYDLNGRPVVPSATSPGLYIVIRNNIAKKVIINQ